MFKLLFINLNIYCSFFKNGDIVVVIKCLLIFLIYGIFFGVNLCIKFLFRIVILVFVFIKNLIFLFCIVVVRYNLLFFLGYLIFKVLGLLFLIEF